MVIALKNISSSVDIEEVLSGYIKDVVADPEEISVEDSGTLSFLPVGLLARDSVAIWTGDESTDPTEFVLVFWSTGNLVVVD